MYAVVKAGGKQHKVAVGDVVEVNRLEGDAGDSISLPALLVVDGSDVTTEGAALAKITVTGEIVGHHKGPKIKILKYKNKTGYRKRIGHRQHLTELLVTDIDDGKPKKKQPAKAAAKSDTKSDVDTATAEKSSAAKKTASAKSTPAAAADTATTAKTSEAKSTEEKAESTSADSKPTATAAKASATRSSSSNATKSAASKSSKSTDEKED